MKKILLCCIVLSLLSCKAGNNDSVPPDTPPSDADKIVIPESTKAATGEVKVFSVSSLTDLTKLKQISYKMPDDNTYRGLGLAPNGDFWFFTKYGLFAANVHDETVSPRLIIDAGQLVKNFIDSTVEGIYTANAHSVQFSSSDDNKRYWAVVHYIVNYDTAKEEGAEQKSIYILYDSNDGSVKKLNLPDNAIYLLSAEKYISKKGFYYELSNYLNEKYFSTVIRYDPIQDKHFLVYALVDQYKYLTYCNKDLNKCLLMNSSISVPIDGCEKDIEQGSTEEKTKEQVAECINSKLANFEIKVQKMEPKETDVTALIPNDITKLAELMPTFTTEFNLKASQFSSVDAASKKISCVSNKCYLLAGTYMDGGYKNGDYALTSYYFYLSKFFSTDSALYIKSTVLNEGAIYKMNIADGSLVKISTLADETISVLKSYSNSKYNDLIVYAAGDVYQLDRKYFVYLDSLGKDFQINLPSGVALNGVLSSVSPFPDDYLPLGMSKDGKNYYAAINIQDIVDGKELKMHSLLPNDEDASFSMYWKGYAFWNIGGILYVNKPFEEKNELKLVSNLFGKYNSGIYNATVHEDGKVSNGIKFDINADIESKFKCGANETFSTWCPEGQVCEAAKCVTKDIIECIKHSDCESKYCKKGKCVTVPCGTNNVGCEIGSICQSPNCIGLDHEDECVYDSQCQSPNVCKLNKEKNYKICQEVKLECTQDKDCGANFICSSANTCFPKMSTVTVDKGTPVYSLDNVTYNVSFKWTSVKDFKKNTVANYKYKLVTTIPGWKDIDATTVKNLYKNAIKIPAKTQSQSAAFSVWPVISGATAQDEAKMKQTVSVQLSNAHCLLPGAGTTMCPGGYKCTGDQCVKE